MTHAKQYLIESATLAGLIDSEVIEQLVAELVDLRFRRGRLFVIGLGGSAANASHMVNDMRKLCAIDASAPTDNVAELTARANDEGWPEIFADWLQFANSNDALFVLSVGGGSVEKNVSMPIVHALSEARKRGMKIYGIVGRDGGYTAAMADCCLIIPTVKTERVTPHCEAFQAVVWHAIACHPDLQKRANKW